jgi:hypothetical protein
VQHPLSLTVPVIWKIPQYYVFQEIYLFAQKRFCGAEGLENVVNYRFSRRILAKKWS